MRISATQRARKKSRSGATAAVTKYFGFASKVALIPTVGDGTVNALNAAAAITERGPKLP